MFWNDHLNKCMQNEDTSDYRCYGPAQVRGYATVRTSVIRMQRVKEEKKIQQISHFLYKRCLLSKSHPFQYHEINKVPTRKKL